MGKSYTKEFKEDAVEYVKNHPEHKKIKVNTL